MKSSLKSRFVVVSAGLACVALLLPAAPAKAYYHSCNPGNGATAPVGPLMPAPMERTGTVLECAPNQGKRPLSLPVIGTGSSVVVIALRRWLQFQLNREVVFAMATWNPTLMTPLPIVTVFALAGVGGKPQEPELLLDAIPCNPANPWFEPFT